MRTWVKGSARAALLTASFVMIGTGVAQADVTNGDGSLLGGNQINAPINLPINVSGNAAAVAGSASGSSEGGATAGSGSSGSENTTSGENSIGGGNQVNAPVNASVNVCGNSVAAAGEAESSCEGGAESGEPGDIHTQNLASGVNSVLGGNQVNVPVNVSANVCGNSVSVLGDAAAACGALYGAVAEQASGLLDTTSGVLSAGVRPLSGVAEETGASTALNGATSLAGSSTMQSSGEGSVAGGNSVSTPINTAINICGNGVALLGSAVGDCGEPTPVPPGEGPPGEPQPVPPPEEAPVRPAPMPGGDGGNEVSPVQAAPANELPFTGLSLGSLLALALGTMTAGGACVAAASRQNGARVAGAHRR